MLFVLSTFQPKIRSSLISLVKAFFQKSVVLLTAILVVYVCTFVYIFYYFNFWEFSYTSATVVWFFGIAFVMLININHAGEEGYFKKIIIENLKAIVILEFLINLYVFELWAELILVPILLFLGALWGYSSVFLEYKQVEKILSYLMAVFGFGFLSYTIYNIVVDFKGFISIHNLGEFLLPIVFTLLIFPVIYFMALHVSYELLFIRTNFLVKNPSLARYTKWRTLFAFHINLKTLKRWSTRISMYDLDTKNNVRDAIRSVKRKNA